MEGGVAECSVSGWELVGGAGAYIGAATVPNEDFVSAVIYT